MVFFVLQVVFYCTEIMLRPAMPTPTYDSGVFTAGPTCHIFVCPSDLGIAKEIEPKLAKNLIMPPVRLIFDHDMFTDFEDALSDALWIVVILSKCSFFNNECLLLESKWLSVFQRKVLDRSIGVILVLDGIGKNEITSDFMELIRVERTPDALYVETILQTINGKVVHFCSSGFVFVLKRIT